MKLNLTCIGSALLFAGLLASPAASQVIIENEEPVVAPSLAGDAFGYSVATFEEFAFAGSPYADPGGVMNAGTVKIYTQGIDSRFTQIQTLTAPTPSVDGYFGSSVAIGSLLAVVGEPGYNSGAGRVHVYTRLGVGWNPTPTLTINGTVPLGQFGYSVDVSGFSVIIGAPYEAGGGSAYVYDRLGGGTGGPFLTLTGTLGPAALAGSCSITTGVDFTGASVAIDGTTAVVGSPHYGASDEGLVTVWDFTGGTWAPASGCGLSGMNVGVPDFFGGAVEIDGSDLIIGAPGANGGRGEVYAYTGVGSGSWLLVQSPISYPGSAFTSLFGGELSLHDGRLGITAENHELGGVSGVGRAYLYERGPLSGSTWSEDYVLDRSMPLAPNGSDMDIAVHGSNVFVGLPGEDQGFGLGGSVLDYSGSFHRTSAAISFAGGGTQKLILDAGPAIGGTSHFVGVLGSVASSPPANVSWGGSSILAPAMMEFSYFLYFNNLTQTVAAPNLFALDSAGQAVVTLTYPAGGVGAVPASIAAGTYWHSFVVYDLSASAFIHASNPVPVSYQ